MGISANTLFHFTSFENLKGILLNGFYPKCSVEQVAFSNEVFPVAIPMVSFCDIKFSQLKDHINSYGHHAIGLTKKWGVAKGINPVFYVETNTFPHSLIKTMVRAYFALMDTKTNALRLSAAQRAEFTDLLQLIAYCKVNNSKKWERANRQFGSQDINYYDEREWRYFPGIKPSENPEFLALPFIPIFENDKYDGTEAIRVQDEAAKENALKFTLDDIKYIIVENDEEIEELISFLRSNNLFQEHFELLISKINTIQRIDEDH